MSTVSLQAARQAVVRDRVLEGVAQLLASGQELTFAKVAAAADVPERTVYRHFPTREALMSAVYDWANRRIGFDQQRATTGAEAIDLVRRTFPAFDEMAPVIRELLVAPAGLAARLADNDDRRRAAVAVVRHDAPGLDATTTCRLAAVIQLLTSAAAWQALRDYWDLDGADAAAASALAIELLLAAASDRATAHPAGQRGRRSRPNEGTSK